jgi:adenylosuccinate synthase
MLADPTEYYSTNQSPIIIFCGTAYDVETLCDLCNDWYQKLKNYIVDALEFVHCKLSENKNILFEGQLGVMKDLDLGTYPYVTSSIPLPHTLRLAQHPLKR